jgi:integrase
MLSQDLARYVDLHRSMGFKFRSQHLLLRNFAAFAEAHGEEFVRISCVLDWAGRAPSPPQRRNRLLTVRRFALAMQAEDARHEVPAADAMGHGTFKRRIVHIYQPDEIARLMRAAAQLRPGGSIRPLTYSTLFGLLAATGMRISEALALRLEDVTAEGLIIQRTKFQKSRLLPLHDTTRRALDRYLSVRLRLGTVDRALFVSTAGKAPAYDTVSAMFRCSGGSPGRSVYGVSQVNLAVVAQKPIRSQRMLIRDRDSRPCSEICPFSESGHRDRQNRESQS